MRFVGNTDAMDGELLPHVLSRLCPGVPSWILYICPLEFQLKVGHWKSFISDIF